MTTEGEPKEPLVPNPSQKPVIPPLDPEVWERTPEPARQVIMQQRLEVINSPLLPPRILREYEEVVPGLAGKLVSWTEKESQHRRNLENQIFEDEKKTASRGQLFGAITSATGLLIAGGVGVAAAVYASWAATSVAIVVAIVAVGGPFAARILASKWSNDSRNETQND